MWHFKSASVVADLLDLTFGKLITEAFPTCCSDFFSSEADEKKAVWKGGTKKEHNSPTLKYSYLNKANEHKRGTFLCHFIAYQLGKGGGNELLIHTQKGLVKTKHTYKSMPAAMELDSYLTALRKNRNTHK